MGTARSRRLRLLESLRRTISDKLHQKIITSNCNNAGFTRPAMLHKMTVEQYDNAEFRAHCAQLAKSAAAEVRESLNTVYPDIKNVLLVLKEDTAALYRLQKLR